jgi:hypothetical protein
MLKVVTLGLLVVGAVAVAESQLEARELAEHRTKVQRFFGYGFGEGYHAYSCCYPCPDYYQRQLPLAAPVYQSSIYQSTRGMYPYYHQRYRGQVGLPSPYGPADTIEPPAVESIPSADK